MTNERDLILERLAGTSELKTIDLMGFDPIVIGELIKEGLIIRTKERGFGGTISQYYLAQVEVTQ